MRVDELHDTRQHCRIGLGRHAVAEIHHVRTGRAATLEERCLDELVLYADPSCL